MDCSITIANLTYIPSKIDSYYHIFNISGTLVNKNKTCIEDILNDVDENFTNSDHGAGGVRVFDREIRDSYIYKNLLNFELKIEDQPDDLFFDHEFEFIKYYTGGYFARHKDRRRKYNHTHSILLYPPQDIEGGQLSLNINGDIYCVQPTKTEWTGIIFPIEIEHEAATVICGEKKIIKGVGVKN